MQSAILLELERAELAARERRLRAEAEAERLLSDARAQAEALEAGGDEAIREALASRRRELEAEADRAIAAIEAELAALTAAPTTGGSDPAFSRAVDLVIGAVLAEPEA